MNSTIIDLWNGDIAPCERCGVHDPEILRQYARSEQSRETLLRELTDSQQEQLQTCMNAFDNYLFHMLELSFCDGFTLGSKLTYEVFAQR